MINCVDYLVDKNFTENEKHHIIQYIQHISTIMKEHHIEDIKYLNAMYDQHTKEIYLFDCIYTGN